MYIRPRVSTSFEWFEYSYIQDKVNLEFETRTTYLLSFACKQVQDYRYMSANVYVLSHSHLPNWRNCMYVLYVLSHGGSPPFCQQQCQIWSSVKLGYHRHTHTHTHTHKHIIQIYAFRVDKNSWQTASKLSMEQIFKVLECSTFVFWYFPETSELDWWWGREGIRGT